MCFPVLSSVCTQEVSGTGTCWWCLGALELCHLLTLDQSPQACSSQLGSHCSWQIWPGRSATALGPLPGWIPLTSTSSSSAGSTRRTRLKGHLQKGHTALVIRLLPDAVKAEAMEAQGRAGCGVDFSQADEAWVVIFRCL